MQERALPFVSDGLKLDGTLYLPDEAGEAARLPAVVVNSGYKGFHRFYPHLLARALTGAGFLTLGFDYRGIGASEGRKGRVVLAEQARDIAHAVRLLGGIAGVDPQRIHLAGWGMGAALVLLAAAQSPTVRAVACLNGFYNGERWLRTVLSHAAFDGLVREVAADRRLRVQTGQSRVVEAFHHYPLDPATARHVGVELAHIPTFGDPVTLEFSESLLGLDAEACVPQVAPRPLFIAHGERNRLHPPGEAASLYARAPGPKEMYWIDGQHNDFMYWDHPEFRKLMRRLIAFYQAHGD